MTVVAPSAASTALGARVPGDALLHWAPLASAAVLALNDHYLKVHHPSVLTGKLSDAAGLVFFPLLLVSLWEIGAWAAGKRWQASRRVLLVAIVATAVGFSAINVSDVAGAAYPSLVSTAWRIATFDAVPLTFRHTVDPSDLLALPFLLVPWALQRRAV